MNRSNDTHARTQMLLNEQIALREQMERQLTALVAEKEILLKELSHRTKNNLQLILSLLRLKAKEVDHPVLHEAFDDFQARIQAMALLHETLYAKDDLSGIEMVSFIHQMLEKLGTIYTPKGVVLEFEAKPLVLPLLQAMHLVMILNELLTNTLKHAFPEGRAGRVQVVLEHQEERVRLGVLDDGVGMPPEGDKGFGLKLVADILKQLDGTLHLESSNPGTQFWVSFSFHQKEQG